MIRLPAGSLEVESVTLEWANTTPEKDNRLESQPRPFALATTPNGNVAMSFLDQGVIAEWDPSNRILTAFEVSSSSTLSGPVGLVYDSAGELYIADSNHHLIRRLVHGGLATIAGTGLSGYSGDGGPAQDARLNEPTGLACDDSRTLFCSDLENHAVRTVDLKTMTIQTLVGTGIPGFSTTSKDLTSARLRYPGDIAWWSGGLYVTQPADHALRYVNLIERTITTVGPKLDKSSGHPVTLMSPTAVATTLDGTVIIADSGLFSVLFVDPTKPAIDREVHVGQSAAAYMSSIVVLANGDILIA